jgi:hypothetical protein
VAKYKLNFVPDSDGDQWLFIFASENKYKAIELSEYDDTRLIYKDWVILPKTWFDKISEEE